MWAHGNAGLVGEDLRQLVQKRGITLKAFWSIITGIKNGKNSEGFYTWVDRSGMEVEKYMVCAPVSGTPYAVAATTISSEFVYPVKVIEAKAGQLAHQARQVNLAALLTGFLVLGTIILFYGRNLSSRVRHLADVADRICVGELDTGIRITARDEIGDLGNAIAQMRDSIKVSIKRLQRRRK
jgi:HAMP domain-containing protein